MNDAPKDPPIEPIEYLHGVKVVDIGDMRVARGLSRRPISVCPHHSLVYDKQERRIYCEDCETTVDPFDAFTGLVENYSAAIADLEKRRAAVRAAEQNSLISRAAKAVDKEWRSRSTVPICSRCNWPLMPDDYANGRHASMGKDLAKRMVERERKSND